MGQAAVVGLSEETIRALRGAGLMEPRLMSTLSDDTDEELRALLVQTLSVAPGEEEIARGVDGLRASVLLLRL